MARQLLAIDLEDCCLVETAGALVRVLVVDDHGHYDGGEKAIVG